jgi:hypothetical protein
MLQLNFLIEINLIYQQILLITKFEIILKMENERVIILFRDCIVEMVKNSTEMISYFGLTDF